MKLDWKKLFEMQAALDRHIIEDKDLEGQDLLDRKILALQVELGELANETRCFKFWSNKKPSEQHVILEEYVDCLHFVLSIGITLNFYDMGLIASHEGQEGLAKNNNAVTEKFVELFRCISDFSGKHQFVDYAGLSLEFLELGEMLGFTADQVMQAYLDKNEINHQRQNTNY